MKKALNDVLIYSVAMGALIAVRGRISMFLIDFLVYSVAMAIAVAYLVASVFKRRVK